MAWLRGVVRWAAREWSAAHRVHAADAATTGVGPGESFETASPVSERCPDRRTGGQLHCGEGGDRERDLRVPCLGEVPRSLEHRRGPRSKLRVELPLPSSTWRSALFASWSASTPRHAVSAFMAKTSTAPSPASPLGPRGRSTASSGRGAGLDLEPKGLVPVGPATLVGSCSAGSGGLAGREADCARGPLRGPAGTNSRRPTGSASKACLRGLGRQPSSRAVARDASWFACA